MKYLILLALLAAGCATNEQKDYQCFRVHGPKDISSTSQEEAERYVQNLDWKDLEFFRQDAWHYECREIRPPSHFLDNRR